MAPLQPYGDEVKMANVLLALIPGFVKGLIPKKAPWCIFIRRPATDKKPAFWQNMNPGGNSARRCGKAAKIYLDSGIQAYDIIILPKGVTPP